MQSSLGDEHLPQGCPLVEEHVAELKVQDVATRFLEVHVRHQAKHQVDVPNQTQLDQDVQQRAVTAVQLYWGPVQVVLRQELSHEPWEGTDGER